MEGCVDVSGEKGDGLGVGDWPVETHDGEAGSHVEVASVGSVRIGGDVFCWL